MLLLDCDTTLGIISCEEAAVAVIGGGNIDTLMYKLSKYACGDTCCIMGLRYRECKNILSLIIEIILCVQDFMIIIIFKFSDQELCAAIMNVTLSSNSQPVSDASEVIRREDEKQRESPDKVRQKRDNILTMTMKVIGPHLPVFPNCPDIEALRPLNKFLDEYFECSLRG